jgi:hypothetical protein
MAWVVVFLLVGFITGSTISIGIGFVLLVTGA